MSTGVAVFMMAGVMVMAMLVAVTMNVAVFGMGMFMSMSLVQFFNCGFLSAATACIIHSLNKKTRNLRVPVH